MHTAIRQEPRPIGPGARPPLALGVLALGALLLVTLAACGSSTVSRRVSFVETNGEIRFDTGALTVTKGDTLKLTVGNRTDAPQEFTVDGFNIERTVAPDAAVTVDIKARESGTYRVSSQRNPGLDPISIVVPS